MPAFLVEISNLGLECGLGCNGLKWLAFPKFRLIGGVVVIVGGELKIVNFEYSNAIGKV